MRRGKVLKDLMLGLIYPAVLGTVMYSTLQVLVDPLTVKFSPGSCLVVADSVLGLKLCFLLIAVAFYCFDYMYIMFTREFDWPFFLCDLAFLVILYITISAIGIGKEYLPQTQWILGCYAAFMILYLVWDSYESWRCRREGASAKEKRFYLGVIIWEMISLVVLIIGLFSLDQSLSSSRIAIFMIALITGCFGWFAWHKKSFMEPGEAPNTGLNRTETALSHGPAG